MTQYILDFIYGATKYPSAFFKPIVFIGVFKKGTRYYDAHVEFFNILIKSGFKRTFCQLVFPGQIAGIIKKQKKHGANEYHIRFYKDGTIECELEVGRWNKLHWSGQRIHGNKGVSILEKILEENSHLLSKKSINLLPDYFGSKNFTQNCVRKK